MHFLFVIDPLDSLNLATETSLLLIEEMERRGHATSVATLTDLYLTDRGAGVRAATIRLLPGRQPFYALGAARDQPFTDFDLVLMRKDPPVDTAYLAATFVLEHAAAVVAVVNDP
ncbi:MAG: glutathione synthase, partial [Gaiellaceae bacterium]